MENLKDLKKFCENNAGKTIAITNGYSLWTYDKGHTGNFCREPEPIVQFVFDDNTVLIDPRRSTEDWKYAKKVDLNTTIDTLKGLIPTELIDAIKKLDN